MRVRVLLLSALLSGVAACSSVGRARGECRSDPAGLRRAGRRPAMPPNTAAGAPPPAAPAPTIAANEPSAPVPLTPGPGAGPGGELSIPSRPAPLPPGQGGRRAVAATAAGDRCAATACGLGKYLPPPPAPPPEVAAAPLHHPPPPPTPVVAARTAASADSSDAPPPVEAAVAPPPPPPEAVAAAAPPAAPTAVLGSPFSWPFFVSGPAGARPVAGAAADAEQFQL